jgi:DNA repair protein RecO (recombination protein O)
MSKVEFNGYVIRGISTGETSRIVTLFTLEYGKIRCMAKGVKKSATKKGGALELFSYLKGIIYKKENVELGTISSFDIINDYSGITVKPVKYGYCSAFCEIVDKSFNIDQPQPELFNLMGSFFKYMQKKDKQYAPSLFWSAFIKTIRLLGYEPGLYECVVCGKKNPGRAAFYSPEKGGIICSKDISADEHYGKLSAKGLRTLQYFLARPLSDITKVKCSDSVLKEITHFVFAFAEYHMGLHRGLKSFKFLSQLERM